MNNQPINQSTISEASSLVLASAHRRHGDMLTRLTRTLGLPENYAANLFAVHGSDRDEYGVEISGPDDFDYTIMHTPVPGNLDVICGTLSNLFDAADAAKADSQRRIREATPWRSRYEGIERPHLVLEHTPGWTNEDVSASSDECVHKIFRSEFEPLGIVFDVIETASYPVSVGMECDFDWPVDTPEELLKLGDRTNDFARWLDDMATVTAWVKDHDTIKSGDDHD